MNMNLIEESVEKIYHYLDKDGDGELSYLDFCNITEERRRKIDPFLGSP